MQNTVYQENANTSLDLLGSPCRKLAKVVLDLRATKALIDRLQADSKLRRLCGFDLRHALPSESTFRRAFEEFAASELMQRVHARWSKCSLNSTLL